MGKYIMPLDRETIIAMLVQHKVKQIVRWANSAPGTMPYMDLENYVSEAESFSSWDDETLECLLKHAYPSK